MAGQKLGRRMYDQVGAPFEGAAQIRRRQGVIDDQRNAGVLGDGDDVFQVEHDAAGVGQDFDEYRLALRRQGAAEVFRVLGVNKMTIPA